MTREQLARLRLARTEGIGPSMHADFLDLHGDSAEEALRRLPGRFRPPPAGEIEREVERVLAMGGQWLFLGEARYPPLLAETFDPPPVLALLGNPEALAQSRACAIVGARNASAAGLELAEDLAAGLAAEGVAVVSGLARGIDGAAHLGALRGGALRGGAPCAGRTVAVIAGGLDRPYPREHAKLQARIAAEGGAVVTEAPLGAAPLAKHFPKRNRIVAGLSLGVVVIEAAERSGTLITARLALEAGREVFAVPGHPKDPRSVGGNRLIREGSPLVEAAEHVLALLPDRPAVDGPGLRARAARITAEGEADEDEARRPAVTDRAAQVLQSLGHAPLTVDELSRRCQLPAPDLAALLLDLELAGHIETLPGNRVARA